MKGTLAQTHRGLCNTTFLSAMERCYQMSNNMRLAFIMGTKDFCSLHMFHNLNSTCHANLLQEKLVANRFFLQKQKNIFRGTSICSEDHVCVYLSIAPYVFGLIEEKRKDHTETPLGLAHP